jgi:uncharacterized membrane protein YbaN (DUF454 family)
VVLKNEVFILLAHLHWQQSQQQFTTLLKTQEDNRPHWLRDLSIYKSILLQKHSAAKALCCEIILLQVICM